MKHLMVCREYPPGPLPPGGIGTYTYHMARLLADAGETVHVIAQRWEGAPRKVSESCGGNLVVHRVSLEEPADRSPVGETRLLRGLLQSDCPSQAFSWQAARIAESLVQDERIDLIEAPEWEAPLYYFQLRRALGMGPRRQPPCLVHLHSPSELIFRHNNWDVTLADFLPLKQCEEYSVRAADALLCPSRYLALGARQLFGFTDADVSVIPYPLGDSPSLKRSPDVWSRDSICYLGRLEARKGIIEWVDAAVDVARSRPQLTFEFIGSDTSLSGAAGQGVFDYLIGRIPHELRQRFRFHGSRERAAILKALAGSPVAVVPSRWENLPYSCIEAMSSGMPVLATRTGGMAELVTDGQSGWIAPQATAADLASTLRRVLDTPAAKRAAMGREAEKAVRAICGNQSVLERHLELRARVVEDLPQRSRSIPGPPSPIPSSPDRKGVGVVVSCFDSPQSLAGCLASIANQTQPAERVVVSVDSRLQAAAQSIVGRFPGAEILVTGSSGAPTVAARHLFSSAPLLRAVVFVQENARLERHYLAVAEQVFACHPGLGLMSSFIAPGASRHPLRTPQQAESAICVAKRAEAVLAGLGMHDAPGSWATVTYPEVLVSAGPAPPARTPPAARRKRYSAVALAQRGSTSIAWTWFLAAPFAEKARCLRRIMTQPRRTAQWIAWLLRGAALKAR
jgi:glycogen(starch) synthase